MNRIASLAALAVLTLAAFAAQAHDPALHAPAAAAPAKAKPTACTHLADAKRYDLDADDAAVKTLKARCASQKKSDAAAPAKQTATGG